VTEQWRSIPDWPLYEASSLGRIRNRKTGNVLSMSLSHKGYLRVDVYRDGKDYKRHVHRLVCAAWNGPPPFAAAQAAHLDGSRTNNVPGNLSWATNRENCSHRDLHGRTARGERCGNARLSSDSVRQISGLLSLGESQKDIATRFGVSAQAVHYIATGHTWTHVTGFQTKGRGAAEKAAPVNQ
jgi:hypothetical protein